MSTPPTFCAGNSLSRSGVRHELFVGLHSIISLLPEALVPVGRFLCKAWFGVCLALSLIACWCGCQLCFLYPGDIEAKRARCCYVNHYCFRYLLFFPCPWLALDSEHGPHAVDWSILKDTPTFIMLNHTSFLDAISYIASCPPRYLTVQRTLMKSSLFKIPFFGTIASLVGHFPVHFNKDALGSFSVDKDAQMEVMSQVDTWVGQNGSLAFFPEGQVNRNPKILQTFRRGAFNLPAKHNMQVVCFVASGNETGWPAKESLGGYPTQIRQSMVLVAPQNHKLTAEELMVRSQKLMQAEVDRLYGTQ